MRKIIGIAWEYRNQDKADELFLKNNSPYVIISVLLTDTQQQGGGVNIEVFISSLVAITAGVACHYIIKWLDGDDKSNK